jgi:hypothetical protein
MGVGEGVKVTVGIGVKVAVGTGGRVGVSVGAGASEEHAERMKMGKNNARKVWVILVRMVNILPLVGKIILLLLKICLHIPPYNEKPSRRVPGRMVHTWY